MRAMFVGIRKQQRGDTLVEVLLAIAVAGSVLGIAFSTMNRNIVSTRAAQERTEAAKYAQGQLESLKFATDTSVTLPGGNFCFNGSGTPVSGSCTSNSLYNATIVSTGTRLYRITVTWDRLTGGQDQIQMVYRTAN